jgi:regulatory protein
MTEAPRTRAAPAPDEAWLQERALAHLARYAATRAGLARILARAVDRWARRAIAAGEDAEAVAGQAAGARAAVDGVVGRLAASGAVDDAAFAAARARRLVRAGRSRRAVAAHLVAKGVRPEEARAALPGEGEAGELAAALAFTRKRRIGAFRRGEADAEGRLRELAMLARAGFPQEVARRALAMAPDEAEAMVIALRQG